MLRIFEIGSGSKFHYLYKRLVLSAALDWTPHKSGPQKMRRTFASYTTAAGGDATAALKHSTRRVTEESYNDPTIANPISPNAVLFDLDESLHRRRRDAAAGLLFGRSP